MSGAEDIERIMTELVMIENALDITRINMEAEREKILAPVKQELLDLELEYMPKASAAEERIEELTAQIKALVAKHGSTVRVPGLMAVYNKGRDKWNTEFLMGLSAKYPKIKDALTPGEPTVSMRKAPM